ncbi:helix-turn-helix domain-containing protein [Methylorubrum zatmanii]|uniref:Helix-turn-helix domain-containing protein n=1 Tax=Methylorubrum zatmanii TaxID=29429 RepID=A0ABW1WPY9_9HYPH|nr:helix-turn-helix transcriptional regulator [Methylorubrum zatmanii]MBD8906061.1 hypothetical protein [Methylorubrum zatmanii]
MIENADPFELDDVFGPGPGETPAERARQSSHRFVRCHTAIAHDSPDAGGLKISAQQAYEAFGWEILRQIPDRLSVGIVRRGCQAKEILPKARAAAGLSREDIAARSGVSLDDIVIVEDGRRSMPMAILVKLAETLGLCPIRFGAVDCTLAASDKGKMTQGAQASI